MKTVLIITYYWPPSGGSGVQRWLKFANYLQQKGWHPVILTPENPQFDMKDATLLNEVHPDIEVLRIPIWEPYQLFKKISGPSQPRQGETSVSGWARFIRGNFFLPDPRVFWRRPAVRFLSEFLKNRKVDFMVTTGPPHSMHLIGLSLKKKLKIPWLADFRDPWSDWDMLDQFNLTAVARSRHASLEKRVVSKADVVLTVSNEWAHDLQKKYARKVEVITNGFDQADFPSTTPAKMPDKFRIAHFGLINKFRYAPEFWKVLSDLCRTNKQFGQMLSVDLYGPVDQDVKSRLLQQEFPEGTLQFHGIITHEEVLEAYGRAVILLMFMNNSKNAAGHIPGKLFEYLATKRPVLAVGHSQGDAASIISGTGAGYVFEWKDSAGMRSAFEEIFRRFLNGTLTGGDSVKLKEFTREHLTEKLIQLLERNV